jgi:hypothetical protein
MCLIIHILDEPGRALPDAWDAMELIASRGVPCPLDHGDIDAQAAAMETALARHKDSPR